MNQIKPQYTPRNPASGQDSSETQEGSKLLQYTICRSKGVANEKTLSVATSFPRTTTPIRQNRKQVIHFWVVKKSIYHILPYWLSRKKHALIKWPYLQVYSQRNWKEAFKISNGSCRVKEGQCGKLSRWKRNRDGTLFYLVQMLFVSYINISPLYTWNRNTLTKIITSEFFFFFVLCI